MKNDKLKVAVIGAGGIANGVHLPSLVEIEDCEIVAIADLYKDKAEAAAKKYGIPNVYRWHLDMLEKEKVDAVFALVQCDLMYRVGSDVILSGNNVLMEKPAGITSYQAASLARQAEKMGVIAVAAMNRRHVPLVQYVKKIMEELTEITQVDGCFVKYSDVAAGWHYASAFVCDIVHAVDLVRYLAGSEPDKVASVIGRFNSPVDNAWSSVIKFRNGITGTLRSNYQCAARMHNFEIHGPKASAYINLGFPGTNGCDAKIIHSSGKSMYSQSAVGVGSQKVEHIDGAEIAGGTTDNFKLYAHYGYKSEDIDFLNAVRNGGKPMCTIADAVKTMELVEMMLANGI